MDKKELILTVAKDIYLARASKDIAGKKFADIVKEVEAAYDVIKA